MLIQDANSFNLSPFHAHDGMIRGLQEGRYTPGDHDRVAASLSSFKEGLSHLGLPHCPKVYLVDYLQLAVSCVSLPLIFIQY